MRSISEEIGRRRGGRDGVVIVRVALVLVAAVWFWFARRWKINDKVIGRAPTSPLQDC